MGRLQKYSFGRQGKVSKKGSKIDPRNNEHTVWRRSFGTSKPRPQKEYKIKQKKEKSGWGGLGEWRKGRRSWEMTKSSTRICKVIQHALHPCGFQGISAPGDLIWWLLCPSVNCTKIHRNQWDSPFRNSGLLNAPKDCSAPSCPV